MKKGTWLIIGLITLILIFIWVASPFIIDNLLSVFNSNKNHSITSKEIGEYYSAVGVLFTGLAFLGTITAILIQQKNFLRQTSYDAIKNVLNKVQDDEKYIESRDFILQSLPVEIKKIQESENDIGTKELKKYNYQGFSHLLYFCRTMEYIGIVSKNDYVDEKVLIQYIGKTIIETFHILFRILNVDIKRMGDDSAFYFVHYRYLYHLATKNRVKFKNINSKSIKKYHKTEIKICEYMDENAIDFDKMMIFNYSNQDISEESDKEIIENCFCDCDSCDD